MFIVNSAFYKTYCTILSFWDEENVRICMRHRSHQWLLFFVSDCRREGKGRMWNSSLALASWAELSQGLEARRMQSQCESRRKRGGSMPGNRVAERGEYWEHKDEEGEDGWRHLRGLAECRETLKWKTMRKGQGRGWDSNETEKDPGEQWRQDRQYLYSR